MSHRFVWLVLAGALLAALAACGGGGGTSPSPASPTSTEMHVTVPSPPAAPAPTVATDSRVTFYAADPGDSAGAIIAGDFNGDGIKDVVLTAPAAPGPAKSRRQGGEAYLFLGPFHPGESRDAAKGQYDAIIYGATAGDQLGRAAAAGDANGDGIDDIVLASPFAGPGGKQQAGEVYVIFGSKELGKQVKQIDLASQAAGTTVLGAQAGDLTGFTLQTADFSGDGKADLAMGAFMARGARADDAGAGRVYVVNGGRTGTIDLGAGQQDTIVYGRDPSGRLGEEITAGDVNGDGKPDLIVAATFANPGGTRPKAGEVYTIFGPLPASVDIAKGQQDRTILGVDPGDEVGHSLATGDTNGDGIADILAGAVSAGGVNNTADLAGEAYVVYGGRDGPATVDLRAATNPLTIFGAQAKDRLGRSAAMGDVNGDGLADLLIAAPDVGTGGKARTGAVFIFFGRRNLPATAITSDEADLVLYGLDAGDILAHEAFGMPPLQVVDMNGDGVGDILVTAPKGAGPDNTRTDAGEAYIIFMKRAP